MDNRVVPLNISWLSSGGRCIWSYY